MSNLKFKIQVDDGNLTQTVKSVNSLKQALADAQKEANDLDIGSAAFKEAQENIEELKSDLREATGSTAELGDTFDVAGSQIDKMTGGAVSSLSSVFNSTRKAIQGMNGLKVAIAGTGIGLLVLAVAALTQAFQRSEEGQNKFAMIMARIGTITGTLLDLLADLGDLIINVVTDPIGSIQSFGKAIQENIVNRFTGLLNLLPALSESVGLLLEGKFTEAGKTAGDAIAQVVLGVEDFTDKVVEATVKTQEFFAAQAEKDRLAQLAAQKTAEANRLEIELIEEKATKEAAIADLILKSRDQERFSAEERADFIRQAGQLTDEIIDKEIELQTLRTDAIVIQGKLGKDTLEDKRAEAEAIASLTNLEKRRSDQQRNISNRLLTLTNEQTAAQQKLADQAAQAAQQRLAAARQIEDAENQLLATQLENQAEALAASIQQTLTDTTIGEAERQRILKESYEQQIALQEQQTANQIAQIEQSYQRQIEDVLANENLLQSEKQALIRSFEEQAALETQAAQQQLNDSLLQQQLTAEAERVAALEEFEDFVRQQLTAKAATQFEQELEIQQQRYDQQIEQLEDFLARGVITREQFNQQVLTAQQQNAQAITQIEQAEADRRAAIEDQLATAKTAIVQNSLSAISSLTELFAGQNEAAAKRAFEIQKQLTSVQTLIDTFSSAQAAYKSLVGVPVVGPALATTAAAAAVAGGLANVRQIQQQNFDSPTTATPATSTSAAAVPTTGQPSTPNFELFGQANDSTIQGADDSIPQGQQGPIQAFVSETDFANTSNRLRSIRRQSEL